MLVKVDRLLYFLYTLRCFLWDDNSTLGKIALAYLATLYLIFWTGFELGAWTV